MSKTRVSLLQILQTEINGDVIKKNQLTHLKNKLSDPRAAPRIFDHFPTVLPHAVIEDLRKILLAIIAAVPQEGDIEDQPFLNLTSDNQKAIQELNKKIVEIGCEELLEKDRQVFRFLDWYDKVNADNIVNMMSAYVAAVLQGILKNFYVPEKDEKAITAVLLYFSTNYGKWTFDILKTKEHTLEKTYDEKTYESHLKKIHYLPIKKTAVGAVTLAGLFAVGVLLIKSIGNSNIGPSPSKTL